MTLNKVTFFGTITAAIWLGIVIGTQLPYHIPIADKPVLDKLLRQNGITPVPTVVFDELSHTCTKYFLEHPEAKKP